MLDGHSCPPQLRQHVPRGVDPGTRHASRATPLDAESSVSGGSARHKNLAPMPPGALDTTAAFPLDTEDLDSSDDEMAARITLTKRLQNVSNHAHDEHFLGKSSSLMFINAAIDMKHSITTSTDDVAGNDKAIMGPRSGQAGSSSRPFLRYKRPEFWNDKVRSLMAGFLSVVV